jgi:general secretion pathway protein L
MENRLPTAVQDFLRWWGAELRELLPSRTFLLRNAHAPRLVLSVEGPHLSLLLEKAGRSELFAAVEIEADGDGLIELAQLAKARPELPVGLRFGTQGCYVRRLELPAAAEADFGRILDLDMERTTPFRAADVLTAYCIAPGIAAPHGKRALRHVIIKRRTIEPLIEKLRDLGIEPDFADCWSEDRQSGLPVNVLAAPRRAGRWRGPGLLPALGGVFVALAVAAVAVPILRYQNALDALNAQTATAKSEAATVRQAVEASQAASAQIAAMGRLLKARVPLARIMEELTTVMPDSAWVSDLRIDGNVVEFTGFAKSAAALVAPLENSPLFVQASLTSPVVLDSAEDKERFSIRLRLDGPSAAPNAEAGGDAEAARQTGTER